MKKPGPANETIHLPNRELSQIQWNGGTRPARLGKIKTARRGALTAQNARTRCKCHAAPSPKPAHRPPGPLPVRRLLPNLHLFYHAARHLSIPGAEPLLPPGAPERGTGAKNTAKSRGGTVPGAQNAKFSIESQGPVLQCAGAYYCAIIKII